MKVHCLKNINNEVVETLCGKKWNRYDDKQYMPTYKTDVFKKGMNNEGSCKICRRKIVGGIK